MIKAPSIFSEIRSFAIISIGLMIYSFGWTAILLPAELVSGGSGGVGVLVYYATGGADSGVPIGVTYLAFNAILLAIGFLLIGPKFGAKTIYAICFNSVVLTVLQKMIPPDLVGLMDDKLLSAILAGVFCGLGTGIVFTQGGSSGGTDIIAMIINKYKNISLGKLVMFSDMVIIGCSYFVLHDIPTIIYGFVTMGILGYTIDIVLSGSKQSSQIMVFSRKYAEIGARVMEDVKRGVSYLEAEGGYSKSPMKVVMVICRKSEQTNIFRIIKEIDPDAFISVGSVMGVYGRGFDALRVKK